MHAKIKYKGIVAYTVLNVCEEIHQFLPSNKKMQTKENWFLFSASWCTSGNQQTWCSVYDEIHIF